MPAPGDGPRLLACAIRRHDRLARRARRLDLMLWTRPGGTVASAAAERLMARTIAEARRCRAVLELRYGLKTADSLR